MTDEQRKIIAKTIGLEGGYVNDPNDAGGETKYGISKRSFPNEDIKNLTVDRATELYKANYYDKLVYPEEWFDIRDKWKLFDISVNMGVGTAMRFFAKLNEDGDRPVKQLSVMQEQRYRDIVARKPTQEKFLKGWLRRAHDLGDGL